MFIVYAEEILSLIYLRGNFNKAGIEMTLKPFYWDALALLTFILYIIPTTLYLAKKEYLLLTKIGSLVYLSGILLNYLLTDYFGYYAISMAAFIITGIYGAVLLFYSRKIIGRYGKYFIRILLMIFSGVMTFAVIMVLKIYLMDQFISFHFENLLIIIIINSLITAFVYFVITHILKVNFSSELLKSIKKR
jgi:putative peptidoglycan lipid II flippase